MTGIASTLSDIIASGPGALASAATAGLAASLPALPQGIIALACYGAALALLHPRARRAWPGLHALTAPLSVLLLALGTAQIAALAAPWPAATILRGPAELLAALLGLSAAAVLGLRLRRAWAPAGSGAPAAAAMAPIAADTSLEQRANTLRAEISARTAELERARDALEHEIAERRRLDRHKDELLSIVSHELRTPLTSMSGSLHMLHAEAGLSPVERRELADIALRSTERLIRLVDNVLHINHIDSGHSEFALAPLSLAALTRMAIQDHAGLARQHHVHLALTVADGAGVVHGDADRLMQVFTNLISNAVKHAPRGSTVELAVQERPGRVRVTVSDAGPGIPPELQGRVFDKYVHLARPGVVTADGHGLGLSIARAIVERHQGTIGVESGDGRTSFHFELPATPAPVGELPAPTAAPPQHML